MADVLIYGDMDSYSAREFHEALCEIETETETINTRVCCNGGEPTAMWAMLSLLASKPNPKNGIVDGKAYSGGAFALCYMDTVEAIDTSEFLFHRAAYPSYYESNAEWFDEATRGNLERVNKNLRKAMEAKMDIPLFEQITGCTLNQLFSMDDRKDVFLTAQQAKKVGLVNKIIPITPKKKAEVETAMAKMVSLRSGFKMAAIHTPTEKPNTMEFKEIKNLAEFKAAYPGIYAEAFKEGQDNEFDRVSALNVFRDVDAKAVDAAIAERKPVTATFTNTMLLKATSAKALNELENESAPPITTPVVSNVEETAEAKAKREGLEAFDKETERIRASREGRPVAK